MAELLEISQVSRCYCCLARNDEKRLQIHVIHTHLLKMVLQMDKLLLCYICKKIAEKTEHFVKNVHNFQNLFQDFMDASKTVETVIRENNPIVELSTLALTPGDILTLSGKDEESMEEKLYIAQIKQEDAGDSSQATWEGARRLSNSDTDSSSYDDDDDSYTGSRSNLLKAIKVHQITLTREQYMEERARKAAEDRFVNAAFKCEDCIAVFSIKDTYESHMVLHQESSGKYECDVCKRRIPSKLQLVEHQKYHTNRYKCNKCDYTKKFKDTVKEHYLRVHCNGVYAYTCVQCGKKYRSRLTLHNHVSTKHNPSSHNCSYCSKTFVSRNSLRGHMLMKHAKEQEVEPRHVCKDCGRAFVTHHQLNKHSIKHSDKKDFLCVVCNKSFKTKSSLNFHYKTTRAHVEGTHMLLQCDKCDKTFCTRKKLTQHMNVHLNIRPYKCDQCDSAFTNKMNCLSHKRRVHEEYKRPKNLECRICNKLFDQKHTLRSHIRTHTGEKPYQCKQCPAQFSHSGTLHNHVKLVHLGLTRDGKPKSGKKKK